MSHTHHELAGGELSHADRINAEWRENPAIVESMRELDVLAAESHARMRGILDTTISPEHEHAEYILIIDNVEAGPARNEGWAVMDADVRDLIWQSQTGQAFSPQNQVDYYANTLRYRLGATPHDTRVQVWRSRGAESLPDLTHCVGIVGSGSELNVHDDDANPDHVRAKVRVAELFDEVFKRKVPVLGICFSSQMALHLLSQETDVVRYMHNPAGERSGEGGLVTLTRTPAGQADVVLGEFPDEFKLVASHVQEVDPEKLPAGSVLLASSKDCSVQIVRMREHMIFIQSHPETAWAWVAALEKNSTKPGETPKPLDPALMDSQTIAHGEVIFSGFLRSVQQYTQSK